MKPFRGFDSLETVRIYKRHMPHWRQDGCTYFVTFRLADSIPRKVLEVWAHERAVWFAAWGIHDESSSQEYQNAYARIPESVRTKFERDQLMKPLMELDQCHGSCIFRKPEHAACLADALRLYNGKKLQCGDFVVMPNHVHWVVMPLPGFELQKILQQVKSYVSTQLGQMDRTLTGKIWQPEFYDRCIRNREELARIRRYIERNPAKANLKVGMFCYERAEWLDIEVE